MNKILLILVPALLFAQEAKVEAKPEAEKKVDPITDKMRFDFAVAQRDWLQIQAQAMKAERKMDDVAAAIKAACEGSGLSYNMQLNQFGCSPKDVAGVDAVTGRRIAKADQKAGMPPPNDAGEQRKRQLAEAAKKKADEEAKKKAEEKKQ